MLRIAFCETGEGQLLGFRIKGHAGYAEHGKDIVCAAVSALGISTANALAAQGVALSVLEVGEGKLRVMTERTQEEEASIRRSALLALFCSGVSRIAETYGANYVQIEKIRL